MVSISSNSVGGVVGGAEGHLSHNYTRRDSPQHIDTLSPLPGSLLPQQHSPRPEEPMTKWPTARSGGVSRTGPERGLLTEGLRGPWSCSRAWRTCTAQGPRGEHGDPSHPHHPIPAVLKYSHQIGHRCQLLLTRPLHPAGLQGPLRQREASSRHPHHPTWGHRWAKASGTCSCLSQELSRPAPGFRVKKEEVVPEPQP